MQQLWSQPVMEVVTWLIRPGSQSQIVFAIAGSSLNGTQNSHGAYPRGRGQGVPPPTRQWPSVGRTRAAGQYSLLGFLRTRRISEQRGEIKGTVSRYFSFFSSYFIFSGLLEQFKFFLCANFLYHKVHCRRCWHWWQIYHRCKQHQLPTMTNTIILPTQYTPWI